MKVQPKTSVILNVLEDQLDRFIDPALVRDTLATVVRNTEGKVLLNADDQNCLQIAKVEAAAESAIWFGFAESLAKGSNLQYAPTYLEDLPKPSANVLVESYQEQRVSLLVDETKASFQLPSRGVHFALDAVAAIATAREILGKAFDLKLAAQVLDELPPVFSRGEVRAVDGENIEFILVQNPASMQLNLDNLDGQPDQVLFAIGRDVHDPSWMWTVDYSNLDHVDIVSGYNAYEAALVLSYNDVVIGEVIDDLDAAIERFFALPKPSRGMKTVIFSADAMRRLRRSMGFWSPEEVER
jgi:UDP-N-acetylmuramyl tripeptide synthase